MPWYQNYIIQMLPTDRDATNKKCVTFKYNTSSAHLHIIETDVEMQQRDTH